MTNRDAAAVNETIAVLAFLFPSVFAAEPWMPHRPLKVGIHHDLEATGLLSAREARAALACYTRRRMYLTALVSGGARVNLDGQAAGEVTAEQLESARASLAALDARTLARASVARSAYQSTTPARTASKSSPSQPASIKQCDGLSALKRAWQARQCIIESSPR